MISPPGGQRGGHGQEEACPSGVGALPECEIGAAGSSAQLSDDLGVLQDAPGADVTFR